MLYTPPPINPLIIIIARKGYNMKKEFIVKVYDKMYNYIKTIKGFYTYIDAVELADNNTTNELFAEVFHITNNYTRIYSSSAIMLQKMIP